MDWNEYIIDEKLKYILEKLDLKFKQLGQPPIDHLGSLKVHPFQNSWK